MARRQGKTFRELKQAPAVRQDAIINWPTAIYARLSIENSGKEDHGASIEGQVEICRDYLEERPWLHLTDTYLDNGWTGTNMKRPEFQRLLSDIYSGRIKAVIIKDFSRFSRDYIEAGELLENVFPKLGVRLISVSDMYDSYLTDGSSESLLIPVKNLINSFYATDISHKICTSVHAKQAAGEYLSNSIPYGYRKSARENYRLEPDPETAAVVTQIFALRTQGLSYGKIAAVLESDGVPSPGKMLYQRGMRNVETLSSSRWTTCTVKRILRNPTYLGHLVYGRYPRAMYMGLPDAKYEDDSGKWRVLENMHIPLVTREQFERVQQIAAMQRRTYNEAVKANSQKRTEAPPVFSGLLFCGACGARLGHRRNYVKDRTLVYYYCPNYRPKKCSASHGISESKLKEIVNRSLLDQFSLYSGLGKDTENPFEKREEEKIEQCRKELQSLSIQVNNRRDKRMRLYEDFVEKLIGPEEYVFLKKKYDDEYETLTARVSALQTRIVHLKKSKSDINEWLSNLETASAGNNLSKETLRALIEKIMIYQTSDGNWRIEIVYKFSAVLEGREDL